MGRTVRKLKRTVNIESFTESAHRISHSGCDTLVPVLSMTVEILDIFHQDRKEKENPWALVHSEWCGLILWSLLIHSDKLYPAVPTPGTSWIIHLFFLVSLKQMNMGSQLQWREVILDLFNYFFILGSRQPWIRAPSSQTNNFWVF